VILPPEAHALVQVLAPHFSNPTYRRLSALLAGALLTTGRRTVADLLRTLRHPAPGHRTDYQRVLSRAPRSGLAPGRAPARFPLDHFVPGGPAAVVGDDAVDGRKGPKAYGKARHRDPVRPAHSYTAWRYGRRWVVLAVSVKFPFATRPWARPVLIDLYRCEEDDRTRNRPHRTPARITCGLPRLLLMRFPGRSFAFAGGSSCGTHEVARFRYRHRDRLASVSKLHPDANSSDPPPPYAGTGRPRLKGPRRPKPRPAVATAATFTPSEVGWYGGGGRRVEALEGTGHRYKAGAGLVPSRRVFVRDASGTHRDEYFFTTDPNLTPAAVIGYDRGRWNIETTFQEARSALGLETTRGRCAKTVRRAGPCLLGLYAVVAAPFAALPASERVGAVSWPGKATVTSSDALCAVRRWLWAEAVLSQADRDTGLTKLPKRVRELLLTTLAPAA
jgi:hypothetical protein